MSKRIVRCLDEADRVIRFIEQRLEQPHDELLERVSGDLGKLLFEILPDRNYRCDFFPIGIGRLGKDFTTYRATLGTVKVVYSASPELVLVNELVLPEPLLPELQLMVA